MEANTSVLYLCGCLSEFSSVREVGDAVEVVYLLESPCACSGKGLRERHAVVPKRHVAAVGMARDEQGCCSLETLLKAVGCGKELLDVSVVTSGGALNGAIVRLTRRDYESLARWVAAGLPAPASGPTAVSFLGFQGAPKSDAMLARVHVPQVDAPYAAYATNADALSEAEKQEKAQAARIDSLAENLIEFYRLQPLEKLPPQRPQTKREAVALLQRVGVDAVRKDLLERFGVVPMGW